MVDIQLIQCKNQQKMTSNHRNIVDFKEIGVKESNGDVRLFAGSSELAVSAHAQRKYS